jgi:hypothetical protein
MQITELKEQIEAGKIIEELLEVKSYLPLVEKQLIINKIIDSCIIVDDAGLSRIDFFYKYLTTQISLLVNFTNLEFSEELISDFDYLAEYIGIDWIIDKISPVEVCIIQELVDDELAQVVRINNSVESVLSKNLQKLINSIPSEKSIQKIIKDIPKSINKITPANLEILKGVFNKQGDLSG